MAVSSAPTAVAPRRARSLARATASNARADGSAAPGGRTRRARVLPRAAASAAPTEGKTGAKRVVHFFRRPFMSEEATATLVRKVNATLGRDALAPRRRSSVSTSSATPLGSMPRRRRR